MDAADGHMLYDGYRSAHLALPTAVLPPGSHATTAGPRLLVLGYQVHATVPLLPAVRMPSSALAVGGDPEA